MDLLLSQNGNYTPPKVRIYVENTQPKTKRRSASDDELSIAVRNISTSIYYTKAERLKAIEGVRVSKRERASPSLHAPRATVCPRAKSRGGDGSVGLCGSKPIWCTFYVSVSEPVFALCKCICVRRPRSMHPRA